MDNNTWYKACLYNQRINESYIKKVVYEYIEITILIERTISTLKKLFHFIK